MSITSKEILEHMGKQYSAGHDNFNKILEKFNFTKAIKLLESNHKENKKIQDICAKYKNLIHEGKECISLLSDFVNELAEYRTIKDVKNIHDVMKQKMHKSGVIISLVNESFDIVDDEIREDVQNHIGLYYGERTPKNTVKLARVLDEGIANGSYACQNIKNRLAKKIDEAYQCDDVYNDDVTAEYSYEQRLAESASELANKKIAESQKVVETPKEEKTYHMPKNNIGLAKAIKRIKNDRFAQRNESLMNICESFETSLKNGICEEALANNFINTVIPHATYLNVVKDEVDTLNARANSVPAILTNLLETMKTTFSSYIVPVIEERVAEFCDKYNNKNGDMSSAKWDVMNALRPWNGDKYVAEMIRVIHNDDFVTGHNAESRKSVISLEDRVKLAKENTIVEECYSPVFVTPKGRAVFAIGDTLYEKNKKGVIKSLSRETRPYILESANGQDFLRMVNVLKNSDVFENFVVLPTTNLSTNVKVFKGHVEINENKYSFAELENSQYDICNKYNLSDTEYAQIVNEANLISENIDSIAHLDFVQSITSKINENKAYFIRDENSLSLIIESAQDKTKLYRNINPIAAKNVLNKSLGISVSDLYEDLMSDQDKFMKSLYETQNNYEDAIKEYDDMIEDLEDALDDAEEDDKDEIEEEIKNIKERQDELKDEFREWQKSSDKIINAEYDEDDEDDEDGDVEGDDKQSAGDEPMTAAEVEQNLDYLSTPLEDKGDESEDSEADEGDMNDEGEDESNEIITDDEIEPDTEDVFNVEHVEDEEDNIDYDAERNYLSSMFDTDDNTPDDDIDFDSDEEESDIDSDIDSDNYNYYDYDVDGQLEDDIDADDELDRIAQENGDEKISLDNDVMFDEDGDVIDQTTTINPEDLNDEGEEVEGSNNSSYDVVDIHFNKNIKNNTISKSGEITVKVDEVTPEGTIISDTKIFTFSLDGENTPVIDNTENIPLDLYELMYDAITDDADYDEASENGVDAVDNVSNELTTTEETTFDDIIDDPVQTEPTLDGEGEQEPQAEVTTVTESKKSLKESKRIISVKATFGKLSESKKFDLKKVKKVNESEDEVVDNTEDTVEDTSDDMEDILPENDVFTMLQSAATEAAEAATTDEDNDLNVKTSDIQEYVISDLLEGEEDADATVMNYFTVSATENTELDESEDTDEDDSESNETEEDSQTIYIINNEIYTMESEGFNEIINDDELSAKEKLEKLTNNDSVSVDDVEDAGDVVSAVFMDIAGDDYEISTTVADYIEQQDVTSGEDLDVEDDSKISESLKKNHLEEKVFVKKHSSKLSAEGDYDKSKLRHDIVYGSKKEQDREQEAKKVIADNQIKNRKNNANATTTANGTPDQNAQEQQTQPTQEQLRHPKLKSQRVDEEFKVGDMIQNMSTKEIGAITSINGDNITMNTADGEINLSTSDVMAQQNLDTVSTEIGNDLTPAYISDETFPLEKRMPVNIMVDGYQCNNGACYADVNDIFGNNVNGVMVNGDEDGINDYYHSDNVIPVGYAWGVYNDDMNTTEPERKCLINSEDYLSKNDDEYVKVIFPNSDIINQVVKGKLGMIV